MEPFIKLQRLRGDIAGYIHFPQFLQISNSDSIKVMPAARILRRKQYKILLLISPELYSPFSESFWNYRRRDIEEFFSASSACMGSSEFKVISPGQSAIRLLLHYAKSSITTDNMEIFKDNFLGHWRSSACFMSACFTIAFYERLREWPIAICDPSTL